MVCNSNFVTLKIAFPSAVHSEVLLHGEIVTYYPKIESCIFRAMGPGLHRGVHLGHGYCVARNIRVCHHDDRRLVLLLLEILGGPLK